MFWIFLCHIIFVLWRGRFWTECLPALVGLVSVFLDDFYHVSFLDLVRFYFSGFVLKLFVSAFFVGEFDPGSGRTLAACLTHASRTERPLRGYSSGERVSNTWVICPGLWDKPGKLGLIPDMTSHRMVWGGKLLRFRMGPRPISLLVG